MSELMTFEEFKNFCIPEFSKVKIWVNHPANYFTDDEKINELYEIYKSQMDKKKEHCHDAFQAYVLSIHKQKHLRWGYEDINKLTYNFHLFYDDMNPKTFIQKFNERYCGYYNDENDIIILSPDNKDHHIVESFNFFFTN